MLETPHRPKKEHVSRYYGAVAAITPPGPDGAAGPAAGDASGPGGPGADGDPSSGGDQSGIQELAAVLEQAGITPEQLEQMIVQDMQQGAGGPGAGAGGPGADPSAGAGGPGADPSAGAGGPGGNPQDQQALAAALGGGGMQPQAHDAATVNATKAKIAADQIKAAARQYINELASRTRGQVASH